MSDNSSEGNLETRILKTFSTLDYRAERWGVENIPDEMIQNSLPSDCGGTDVWTYLSIDGKWIELEDLEDIDPESIDPEAICFIDNGTGFDYIYTVLHHSSKKDRNTQTGKFGEGLKMLSATALRHNVEILIRSKDWSARPVAESLDLPQEGKKVDLLCQEITENLDEINGSQSFIFNPPRSIVERVLSYKDRIFLYRKDLPEREIKLEKGLNKTFLPKEREFGELFVKQFKYDFNKKLFLTYQINGRQADSLITPDRDSVRESQLEYILEGIVCCFNAKNLITPLITKESPDYFEKNLPFTHSKKPKNPRIWRKTFYQIYGGENTVLSDDSSPNIDADARSRGFRVVEGLPKGVCKLLHNSGVRKSSDVINYEPRYELVSLDELNEDERYVISCFNEANQSMFGNNSRSPRVYIFSAAYDGDREVKSSKGMCYMNRDPPEIYIRRSELASLATYAHEAVHLQTKAVDITKEFEEGLTEALGSVLNKQFGIKT